MKGPIDLDPRLKPSQIASLLEREKKAGYLPVYVEFPPIPGCRACMKAVGSFDAHAFASRDLKKRRFVYTIALLCKECGTDESICTGITVKMLRRYALLGS